MNHFAWTKSVNDNEKVELTLSEGIEDLLINTLKQEWLVPIIQGERKVLPDNTVYYSFFLPSEDAELIKEMFLQAFTKVTGYNLNN